jgi:hypothetical protein
MGNLEGICLLGLLREMITFVNPEVTQVLSLSEALTSLGHTYLGSFLLDPEDDRNLSFGAIWSLVGGTGLP